MAALIFAMRLTAVSLSLALSRDVLLRGVKTGETLRTEVGTEVMLEVDWGAGLVLPLLPMLLAPPIAAGTAADAPGARPVEPLTLREASNAMICCCRSTRGIQPSNATRVAGQAATPLRTVVGPESVPRRTTPEMQR